MDFYLCSRVRRADREAKHNFRTAQGGIFKWEKKCRYHNPFHTLSLFSVPTREINNRKYQGLLLLQVSHWASLAKSFDMCSFLILRQKGWHVSLLALNVFTYHMSDMNPNFFLLGRNRGKWINSIWPRIKLLPKKKSPECEFSFYGHFPVLWATHRIRIVSRIDAKYVRLPTMSSSATLSNDTGAWKWIILIMNKWKRNLRKESKGEMKSREVSQLWCKDTDQVGKTIAMHS